MTLRAVTVSSYNDANNSFYENSGRGFLSNGLIKPDVAAPGVNVSTPVGKVTGGSMAAALTAGGVAQFMEWAVVRFNSPSAGSQEIKNYLIRGANWNSSNTYLLRHINCKFKITIVSKLRDIHQNIISTFRVIVL